MIRIPAAAIVFLACASAALAAKPTRFWNLTENTITGFSLAPTGTGKYGPDLAKADKDGTVDHDERLKVTGVQTGSYDVKLTDAKGRNCVVKSLAIKEGEVFSIEEKQLTCGK